MDACGNIDFCAAPHHIKCVKRLGGHGAGPRLEAISFVWLEFCHFVHTIDAMPHHMTDGAKNSSHPGFACRDAGGCQRSILPLKIVFRRGNKTKDLMKRPVNVYI